jgi:cytochrome c peroxidase
VFTITCTGPDNPFLGHGFETNDPGLALITGRCADAGKLTVPQLRGLASRAPYFHDGSAATLPAVVGFCRKRFGIPLTDQDARDLASFLAAL